MTMVRVYLVVSGRAECRLTRRRPQLDWDEVAFPITVTVPPGWGRIYDEREARLELPAPPDISSALQVWAPLLPEAV